MPFNQMKKSKSMEFPHDIPVDEAYGYDPYDADTTATLASTIHDVEFKNGRRYLAYRNATHLFPNDDLNTRNEKIGHLLFLKRLGDRHFLAPIKSPRYVLDIGTGTGDWAFDMADKFPNAEVLGIDLNPVEKVKEALPPNLEYLKEDVREEWNIEGRKYDYVHLRSMFGSDIEWPHLYPEIYDHMESGGYIEQMEVEIIPRYQDDSCPENSIFQRLADVARQMRHVTGREYTITDGMKTLIQEAGFVDVVEERLRLPIGQWSSNPMYQELGNIMEQYFRSGIEGWLMRAMTEYGGKSQEEVHQMVRESYDALDKGKEHIYYTLVVVYGRKP